MNLLITGAWTDAKNYIEEIELAGHIVEFIQQEKDPLPCPYEWVEGVICNGLFLYHPISRFNNLRYIQLTSAGYDRVSMDEIEKRNIKIHNARGVYSIPMAEFALAGVLDLYKGMADFRELQRRHKWTKNRSIRELAGSRVLIVGCGSVGTECAKRFKALDCHVIGIDVFVREDYYYDTIKGLDELSTEAMYANVMILTLPLTDKTRGLINKGILDLFKGIIVNISRGGVIDQKALETWDGEAVLDVFEEEPLDERSPLWDKKDTIVTPHNSFVGSGNARRLKDVILNNLETLKEDL